MTSPQQVLNADFQIITNWIGSTCLALSFVTALPKAPLTIDYQILEFDLWKSLHPTDICRIVCIFPFMDWNGYFEERPDRLAEIPGFDIDRVASAAGSAPEVLRLENLDTDFPPPPGVIERTRQAISLEANSYLPFTGQDELRELITSRHNQRYGCGESASQCVITCGGTEAILDGILAGIQPGDAVVVSNPTYAGIINRIRLAGGIPLLCPLKIKDGGWRLDLNAFQELCARPGTMMVLLMSPSMPSGHVLNREEWTVVADCCDRYNLLLLYDAAMEALRFDGLELMHPFQFEGLKGRTAVIGSFSKEFRMIAWRVGWIIAPKVWAERIARVHIFNAVTISHFAQLGAIAALEAPEDIGEFIRELESRRNEVMKQLSAWNPIRPDGGWSLLLDLSDFDFDAREASQQLLEKGKIAATPMDAWGSESAKNYLRIVFSREPLDRLSSLEARFQETFGH